MPYWDLNVDWTNPAAGLEIAEMARKLGYSGIVFNHTTDKVTAKDTCNIKPLPLSSTNINAPQIGLLRNRRLRSTNQSEDGFQQKTRITIVMSDASQQHGLSPNNSTLASYDIIAVAPSTDKILHAVLQSEVVDLISFDFSQRLPFFLKITPVNMAISRGIFFEVSYSASLNDSTARRNFISNMQHLLHLTRGRQVVFTSKAANAFQIRSPQDCVNLSILFGMRPDEAKFAISNNCHSVLKHAETRGTAKGAMKLIVPDELVQASKKRKFDAKAQKKNFQNHTDNGQAI